MDVSNALRSVESIQKKLDKLSVKIIKEKEGDDVFAKVTSSAGKASDTLKTFQEQLREAKRQLERDLVKNNMSLTFLDSDEYKAQAKRVSDLTQKVQQFKNILKDLNMSKSVDYMGSGYGFNAKTRQIDKQIADEQKRQAAERRQQLIEERNQVKALQKEEKERLKNLQAQEKAQSALEKKNTFKSYSAELSKLEHQLTTVFHNMQQIPKTSSEYKALEKDLTDLTKQYAALNRESVNFRKQIGISNSRGFYDINHNLDYFRAKVRSRLVYSFATEAEGLMTNLLPNFIDSMRQYQANRVNFAQVMPNDFANDQEAMNNAMREFIQVASDYGASVEDVIEAGRLWGRIYKDVNIIQELVRASTKLSITDDMSLVEVNKGLEATMQQYAIHLNNANEAQEYSSKIIDTWAKLADNAGVTAANLAAASERAGGAAYQAGVGFDSLQAMIATMSQVTGKAGGEIGRTIRSMLVSMNTDKARKEIEKLGVSVYELADDGTKRLRSMEDVIPEVMQALAKAETDISGSVLTFSGGKYQYNNVMALMRSYDLYMKNLDTARNSQGWADEQVAIQYETISRQVQALNADLQQLIATLDEAGAGSGITWIIQVLRDLVQTAANIKPENIKTLTELIGAFAAFKTLKGLVGVVGGVSSTFSQLFGIFSSSLNIIRATSQGIIGLAGALRLFGALGGYVSIVMALVQGVYMLVDAMGSNIANQASDMANSLQELNASYSAQSQALKDNTENINKYVETIRQGQETLKEANLTEEERTNTMAKVATATDNLKRVIGEKAYAELEAAGFTEEAVGKSITAYQQEIEVRKELLIAKLEAELQESESVYNNTEYRIKNYDLEIEKLKEVLKARKTALESDGWFNTYGKDNSIAGWIGRFVHGRQVAEYEEVDKRIKRLENLQAQEKENQKALENERAKAQRTIGILTGEIKAGTVSINGAKEPIVENTDTENTKPGKNTGSTVDFSEKAKRNQYQRVYNELVYEGRTATTQFNNALKELENTERFEGKTVDTATKRIDLYKQRKDSLIAYQKQLEEYQDTLIKNLDEEMAANQEVAQAVGYKQDATVNEKLRNIEVNRELYQQIKSYSEIVNQISKVNQQIETTKGQVTDVTNKVRELTELPQSSEAIYQRAMRDAQFMEQSIKANQNLRDPYAEERSYSQQRDVLLFRQTAAYNRMKALKAEYEAYIKDGNAALADETWEELQTVTNNYDQISQELEKLAMTHENAIRSGLADITTSLVVEGESWKDIWQNLWQDLAREAIQVLFGVQNVAKSFLGSLVGGGKGKGKGATEHTGGNINSYPKHHTGASVIGYPKMHSGGMVEQGRKGVVPQLRNDEVVRTLQVGEEVNSLADRRSNEILGAVAMKALDSEQNRPNYVNIMAMDSKSFAEYLNENSDILMAIIGKQQAMGRGTRR